MVITGKDRGKRGKVSRVILDRDRLVVEGVNIVKRHTKGQAGARQAGIIQKESPLHISNVVLVCSKCSALVRAKRKTLDDGRKVRVCPKCNETMD
jgi:large subunit ribosomal protein L24